MSFECNGRGILVTGSVSLATPPHCTPSVAIGGISGLHNINGKAIICQGDSWTPHGHTTKCIPSPKTQGTATSNITINGVRVALEGDTLDCGAFTQN